MNLLSRTGSTGTLRLGATLVVALILPFQMAAPIASAAPTSPVIFDEDSPGTYTYSVDNGIDRLLVILAGGAGGGPGVRGAAGYISGEISVSPGTTIQVNVGGRGSSGADVNRGGGFNGGGKAGCNHASNCFGGGGATDIRIGGVALSDRVLVAGGGGGGSSQTGGSGGMSGGDAYNNGPNSGGKGATASAGGAGGNPGGNSGSLGVGGEGAGGGGATGGAGGGGGYFGGGGGALSNTNIATAGGGGSSWAAARVSALTNRDGVWLGEGFALIVPLLEDSQVFDFTGAVQQLTLPSGTESVLLQAFGARGGWQNPEVSGKGGYIAGAVDASGGDTLNVYVGGKPLTGGTAGYNGGGSSACSYGGGGGGASDVRINGTALSDRVIVAGGGGAATNVGAPVSGGDGGYPNGAAGGTGSAVNGGGGSQAAGGVAGIGGSINGSAGSIGTGGTANKYNGGMSDTCGGAGGGGYYGGGSGAVDVGWGGGGGGSSWFAEANPTTLNGVMRDHGLVIVTPIAYPLITEISPSQGSPEGGTTVTIKGTDFKNVTSVMFNNVAAQSYTVDSNTQITAVTPPGTSGEVDVEVNLIVGGVRKFSGFTYTGGTTIDNAGGPAEKPTTLLAPTLAKPVQVIGKARVGKVLRLAEGAFSGATSYSYQWLRCKKAVRDGATSKAKCRAVKKATLSTYRVVRDDRRTHLAVKVTATNASGSLSSTSSSRRVK